MRSRSVLGSFGGVVGRRGTLEILAGIPVLGLLGCTTRDDGGRASDAASIRVPDDVPNTATPASRPVADASGSASASAPDPALDTTPVVKSDAEWKKILTPEQYSVCREKGTERPGSSPLVEEHRAGNFYCVACGALLFKSTEKFESGTGWPSFFDVTKGAQVTSTRDLSYGMDRVEVTCTRCGAHLGHVFDDGPKPTGLRYCINGVALKFVPA